MSRVAAAVAAAFILAACGAADTPAADSIAPPGSGDESTDDSGLRAPTPINLAAGGASAEATPAADAASSEMRIAPWVVEYVLGDGLPALPTDDTGLVYDAAVEATADQVASIAAAFGVPGEPVRTDDGYAVTWRVGPDDGSAANIWLYDDALLSWNYNAPWAASSAVEPCAVTISPDGSTTDEVECPEPEPPVGVPSADEAEQRAVEIMTALGVDVSTVTFETHADEWFASVQVSRRLDDRADSVGSWSFGFGAEGVLQYASGSLATPEAVGPYPLIDLETAVARLNDGSYGYGGFGGIATDVAVADVAVADAEALDEPVEVETPPASVPVDPATSSVSPDEGETAPPPDTDEPAIDEPVLVDPLPVEPPPSDEPVVVTLVDVEPDLWWAWDTDGSAWLLPAYRFIDTDGGWHVVPAVTDDYLIMADPIDTPLPAPVPLPPETEPAPEPEESQIDVPDVVDIEPGTDPEVARSMFAEYVGVSLDEFTATAKELGYTVRVVVQDGESLAVTMDYRIDRVNVAVEGNQVVAVESIG